MSNTHINANDNKLDDLSAMRLFELFLKKANLDFSKSEGEEYVDDELCSIVDYGFEDILVSFKISTGDLVLFTNVRIEKKCNYTCPIDHEIYELLNEDIISKKE